MAQWDDSPYKGWAEKQDVMPAAKEQFNCSPIGFCSCCNHAEIVQTKFRPTPDDDGWEWFDPWKKIWRVVPQEIINWDTPTPDGRAVLFVFPPVEGTPRCFYPPGKNAQ